MSWAHAGERSLTTLERDTMHIMWTPSYLPITAYLIVIRWPSNIDLLDGGVTFFSSLFFFLPLLVPLTRYHSIVHHLMGSMYNVFDTNWYVLNSNGMERIASIVANERSMSKRRNKFETKNKEKKKKKKKNEPIILILCTWMLYKLLW